MSEDKEGQSPVVGNKAYIITNNDHEALLQHVFPEVINSTSDNETKLTFGKITQHIQNRLQSGTQPLPAESLLNNGAIRVGPPLVQLCLTANIGGEVLMESDDDCGRNPPLHVTGGAEFSSIRACTGVASGRWFYEVYLSTKGVMQLGWCTVNCHFTREKGVGDTSDSYAFDGARHKKWNVSSKRYGETWLSTDVISCAIDCDEGTVSFYRNGRNMGVAFKNIRLGPGVAYFPAVTLFKNESVTLNFGGTPIMHPIDGYRSLQDPPIDLLKQADLLFSYWERILPMSVDCEKNDNMLILDDISLAQKSPSKNKDVESKSASASSSSPSPYFAFSPSALTIDLHKKLPFTAMSRRTVSVPAESSTPVVFPSRGRSLKSTCMLIVSHLMPFCESHISNFYTIHSHVLPLLLKLCDKSEQPYIQLFLQTIWCFMDRAIARRVIKLISKAALHLYRYSEALEGFTHQIHYLHVFRGMLLHEKTRVYLLRHEFLNFLMWFHMKPPDDPLLASLVPQVTKDDLAFLDDESELESGSVAPTESAYSQAVKNILQQSQPIVNLQMEIINILLQDNDVCKEDGKCSLEMLCDKFSEMIQDRSWPTGAIALQFTQRFLTCIRVNWNNLMNVEKNLPSFEDLFIPAELFCVEDGSSVGSYSSTPRLGGVTSHLMKTYGESVSALLKQHERRREKKPSSMGNLFFKKFSDDSKENKGKKFIKECVIDETMRASNANGYSRSYKQPTSLDKFFTNWSTVDSCPKTTSSSSLHMSMLPNGSGGMESVWTVSGLKVSLSVKCLINLLDMITWIFQKAVYSHIDKISTGTLDTARKFRNALLSTEEKLTRCPPHQIAVYNSLLINRRAFETKLLDIARVVAWLKATIYDKNSQENIFFLWKVMLNTFTETNEETDVFRFVPHFYLEACLNLHKTLRSHFHPFQSSRCVLSFASTLEAFAALLCNTVLHPRIVNTDSRDCILQYMTSFVQQSDCLHALENLSPTHVNRLLHVLTAPYENRLWTNTNWILGRFWKGCGFAFRFYLPKKSIHGTTAETLASKPCPSQTYQHHLKRFLSKEHDIASKFVNSLITQLNWSYSELISNMQDLRQTNVNSILERLVPENSHTHLCLVYFDVTISLLRVLEMIIHLLPDLFLDASRPQSENFCSRLLSILGQILHRSTVSSGLFQLVIRQHHPGLERIDQFHLHSAVAGILVELVLQPDSPKRHIALKAIMNEPGLLLSSIEYMIDGPPQQSPTTSTKSSTVSCLREYDEVSQEELDKLDQMIEILRTAKTTHKDDLEPCKEEDLCVICYGQANSVIFKPCGHMSCRSCISYQVLSKGDCFFCKSSIKRVVDFNGKEIRFK